MIPVVAVVGLTGSGKTSLALELAERLNTEVVSADSMQFYRGMEIGTAAPTPEEQRRVRHHFVSFLAPDERMSAGAYEPKAREVVRQLNERGRTAVVAGGSGLYINALLDGLFEGPPRDEAVRTRLQAEAAEQGNAAMMARLRAVDPAYAATLTSENDLIRIVRALEVHALSGKPFSELHAVHQARVNALPSARVAILQDRALLYDRINRRVVQMMEEGWLEEVVRLLDQGYGRHLARLKALGYREMMRHLEGKQSLEEAVAATQMHHRRYAKRQLTWFRADERIHWLEAGPNSTAKELAEQTMDWLQNQSRVQEKNHETSR